MVLFVCDNWCFCLLWCNCFTILGQEEQHPTVVFVWPVVMEGIFLYNCNQQSLLWQDGWQPRVCPNSLGPKPWGPSQVGRGKDRLSVDRRHHDPAQTGGLDSSFSSACCGLLPDQGRPLDQLGGRYEGKTQQSWLLTSIQTEMHLRV